MKDIMTENAPRPIGPYSQAIVDGDMVFCSGQLGMDPVTGIMPESAADQARQALQNLQAVLQAAGTSLSRSVKVTIFLIDISKFSEVNEVYGGFFTPPFPARTVVQVSALPKGAAVEIDAIVKR